MKFFLGIVIVMVCLVLAAVLALPFLVDLNRYQAQYRPILEDALNRKVSIESIRLMVIPRLGIRVRGVTVMDDPMFSTEPFASLSALEVGVKLGPLFGRRVEVEEVVLREPVIAVIKDSKGVLNLSTLGRRAARGPSREGPTQILGPLAVEEVELTGGKVTYSDRSGRQPKEYMLADLELIMKSVRLGHIAGLHLSTVVEPFNLPVTLDGSFGPLQDTLALEDFDFALRTGGAVANIKGSAVGGSLKLAVTSQVINSAELPVSLPFTKPVKVHGLQLFVETLYPLKQGVPIQDAVTLAKLDFDLELGNSTLIVAGGGASGDYHLAATASRLDTADIPIALPLTKSIQIKDLKLEADAKYPASDGRVIQDTVTVKTLAFDLVMGAASTLTVTGGGPSADFKLTATSSRVDSADLPLATPLKKPAEIKDLRLAIEVHQPRVQISSLTFTLFGGRVQGSGGTTIGITPMPFEGKMTLQGLQLGPVMKAVSNSPIIMTGTADVQLAVTGNGVSSTELMHHLTGTGRLSAKEGTLEGINLLKKAMAVAKGLAFSFDATNTTAFDTLDVTFHAGRGLVNVDRFRLRNRLMEATAMGTLGFDQSLNLRTKVTLLGKRMTLPIIIRGTLKAPTYSLDTSAIGTGFKKLEEEAVTDLRMGGKASEDLLKQGTQRLKKLFGP